MNMMDAVLGNKSRAVFYNDLLGVLCIDQHGDPVWSSQYNAVRLFVLAVKHDDAIDYLKNRLDGATSKVEIKRIECADAVIDRNDPQVAFLEDGGYWDKRISQAVLIGTGQDGEPFAKAMRWAGNSSEYEAGAHLNAFYEQGKTLGVNNAVVFADEQALGLLKTQVETARTFSEQGFKNISLAQRLADGILEIQYTENQLHVHHHILQLRHMLDEHVAKQEARKAKAN